MVGSSELFQIGLGGFCIFCWRRDWEVLLFV